MTTTPPRGVARQYWTGVRALAVLTVLTVAYATAIGLVGQLAMPARANGSLLQADGRTIGSTLIGQSFTTEKGEPLPQWFQSRPSAAGAGYDAAASGPSNLGPNAPALLTAIEQRKEAVARTDGVPESDVPADAVTASASGLDPHISPAYARLQVAAVARARGITRRALAGLVERFVQSPDLGYLGAPTVNVLLLNAALAKMDPGGDR